MAKGPKGERRPADINKRAALIVSIATGETTDPLPPRGRPGGKVGGKARAKALTPQQRSEIAKKAAAKRWGESD
jgi:hypothetical protein